MAFKNYVGVLRSFGGVGANSTGHLEKWVSGAGGLAGILGVMLVSQAYLGLNGSASLVASMGASAVLLFAVPHGPLSQPWAVFGGHMISAVIGVACSKLYAPPFATAALAVALAISAMYYLRCIHPPGGATALTAVAGGNAVHSLGYHYVITPVLLNVLIILSVAILFNLPFPWRRYPAVWARNHRQPSPPATDAHATEVISRDALSIAARAMDPTLNLSEDTLQTVCSLALCKDESTPMTPADIRAGHYYCNGSFGPDWEVRLDVETTDEGPANAGANDALIYKVVAGYRRRQMGSTICEAFADWARYEVCLNDNSWQRVDTRPFAVVTGNAA